ncbi:MAG TPA: dihydrodipicolinate synthase family protein [Candidatus Latescibacteria bacterium]|nr:dihydrodipicolinate synthase family protein [Candidatus Latescibacterota bacterium]
MTRENELGKSYPLPRGIISVLQTPFDDNGDVDTKSLERLVEHAVGAGVNGFLVPAVASEVDTLSAKEREYVVEVVLKVAGGRVPVIVGASAPSEEDCAAFARYAERVHADAYLVAVPSSFYAHQEKARPYFARIAASTALPMVIQDLQFGGYGLRIEEIERLWETIPRIAGFKVETVPAGPKYTAIREKLGASVFIAGGWAIPQMIEALDRGVDALVPESSMVPIYRAVYELYDSGCRSEATTLFRQILPVLSYTNQELLTSIAFFKRLLCRKGIFAREHMRLPGFEWDMFSERVAEELIALVLEVEAAVSLCRG